MSGKGIVIESNFVAGDGRQGKWEATGHIVKLQDSSEEVTMELRDSQKIPVDTTTGTAVSSSGQQLSSGFRACAIRKLGNFFAFGAPLSAA